MAKLNLDPGEMERTRVYKIIAGAVVPRPIGLISTVGRDGRHNVAPFSWFNALSADPPYVCISISTRIPDGRPKDTLRNILDTGEFVVNIVSEDIAAAQGVCSGDYPPDTDEFKISGLTPAPSIRVKAPLVLESRVNFECKVFQTIPLPKSSYTMIIGEVVYIHVDEDVLEENGRIRLDRLRPVGRLVGNAYCTTRDVFSLEQDTFATLGKLPVKR